MISSDSVQDYLKAIYSLSEAGGPVTTSGIAERLRLSPASVTAMIKRLSEAGHLRYQRYQGVELTESGKRLALEVVRHHRLLEAYLHKTLGVPWDKIHDEAEVLEHAISEELEDRIADALGNPTHDPHGDPIPPKNGRYKAVRHLALAELPPGPATIERVSDRDPAALRFLERLGVRPGVKVTVEEHSPFEGAIWIRVGKKRHSIGGPLAASIYASGAKG